MTHDPALDTFVNESAELLSSVEALLLRCESGAADPEIVNELFRAFHTIKGSAGLFGLDPIVKFTHVVESVLDQTRAGRGPISAAAAAILLECSDHIGSLIRKATTGSGDSGALQPAGDDLLERLTAETGFKVTAGKSAAPQTPGAGPGAVVAAGEKCWHISVRFNEGVLKNGMDPLSFIRYLATLGSIDGLQLVDDALPPLEQFDPECCYVGFEINLKTAADKTRIEAAFEFVRDDCNLTILPQEAPMVDFVQLIRDLPEADGRLGDLLIRCGSLTEKQLDECLALQARLADGGGEAPPIGQLLVEKGFVKSDVVDAAIQKQSDARSSKLARAKEGPTIRVDGGKLDQLIDWIGELIIAGAATGAAARQAGLPVLLESAQQMARIVGEIRDQALKLRMVQIGTTFSRFRRVVRDVSRETGKNISLQINGAETELDRTLVEGITDPLTHLVRNAIDHGIESPEIRRERGKPAVGMVRLNAYHDAGSVVIEVSDDGGGLKRSRILAKAIERGIVAAGEPLTDEQINGVIFEPGFSTAAEVTNLSGRGVGMDVVKRNITSLRGTVEVHSEEGQGTRVCIRLPLTLAIIDGFQVGVGDSQFIIPLGLVEECVEITPSVEFTQAAASGHMSLHGSVLPLIQLGHMFEIRQKAVRRQSVVVVRSGGKRLGIVVDELLGELQAVIKPMSKLFSQLRGIGGSSVLGSGKVALILDVPGLLDHSLELQRAVGDPRRPSVNHNFNAA